MDSIIFILYSFRIYGIDNDLISFVDININDFIEKPTVLILNPKDEKLHGETEPLYRMKNSGVIRFMIFGGFNISTITMYLI